MGSTNWKYDGGAYGESREKHNPEESLLKACHSDEDIKVERRVLNCEYVPFWVTVKPEPCLDYMWVHGGFHLWRRGKDVKRACEPKVDWRLICNAHFDVFFFFDNKNH